VLSAEQNKWLDIMKMVVKAKPDIDKAPHGAVRGRLYALVTKPKFDGLIMLFIVLNML